jgi:predicted cupin superfamily sugar epimerase
MHERAADLIERLGLRRHPEGGWYRETHRSANIVEYDDRYRTVKRSAMTSIYYLLEGEDFSAFHRLRSDEVWYFHAGTTLALYAIEPSGALRVHRLGDACREGACTYSVAIAAGTWLGARLEDKEGWALTSACVAPGFEFEDFELAGRTVLTAAFPQHGPIIASLTRGGSS